MSLFDVLTLAGGLCLFLFGMSLMGDALEKRAGDGLKTILGRLTNGRAAGFFTGLGVTAIIQSSSATTVMVVGFVNSGLLTLRQAINVIMGANVGTTVTAWLLSLTGIESSSFFVQLLKPSSFTPVLAVVGIVLYMTGKNSKRKDTATILLGFAVLMYGMETMSGAVAGLAQVEGFRRILLLFTNPLLGVLAGAVLTAVIQSSSASVGILQALASTGQVSLGAAVPIIMGQNIGTCATALLSSIGANRNARRASVVHLCFNLIGTAVLLSLFCLARALLPIAALTDAPVTEFDIAVVHTGFNVLCTLLLLPAAGLLEKLSCRLIPEPKTAQPAHPGLELDERLLATPAIALERCRITAAAMAQISAQALRQAAGLLTHYDAETAARVRTWEEEADRYEDVLGSYLVKLSTRPLSDRDSSESAKLLHVIGDFERISDHAVNLVESAEEMHSKGISFSGAASGELRNMVQAVEEALALAMSAFAENDLNAAARVEPLEQVVDVLKEQLRARHIRRMQQGECSIEAGFVWADLLNNLERVSDHCSNIAGCVIEMTHDSLDVHGYLRSVRTGSQQFAHAYDEYARAYLNA